MPLLLCCLLFVVLLLFLHDASTVVCDAWKSRRKRVRVVTWTIVDAPWSCMLSGLEAEAKAKVVRGKQQGRAGDDPRSKLRGPAAALG